MATIKKGILGGFSGKVGTVIGSSWKGIDYIRSLPKASSKPATTLQTDQRMKFAMVMNFLRPINALINKGYQNASNARTPMNAAVSYHATKALTGLSPDFSIAMPLVVFSQGDLGGAWAPLAESTLPANVSFNWEDNTGSGLAEGDDQALLLVYNVDKAQFIYLESAADRSAASADLIVPANYSGDVLECWISFSSKDGKRMATSVYAGQVTVA